MELKNKRVLVVGLGKSGLAAALFLRRQGAQVTVSDTRSAEALAKEIPALLDAGIMVESGGHGVITFREQELIVVSPGVPMSTPEVAQAKAFGTPVIGELELASRFLQGRVVAITGSNGKTTTTTLLGEIFKTAGFPTLVGGNIGTPVIDLIAESVAPSGRGKATAGPSTSVGAERAPTFAQDDTSVDDASAVVSVLEVSSFQLETVEEFRPWIAVVLNITPDHLDRHGSFEAYAAAKARITERQGTGDFLVLNAEDKPTQMVALKAGVRSDARPPIFWFSGRRPIKQGAFVHGESVLFVPREGAKAEPILPVSEIPLKGAHNVENVLAAVCAARLAGVPAEVIRGAVRKFKAVEHRLELVRVRDGVEFYNDSKATNVDATMKAVASFAGGIHLILGGKDKESDYTLLSPLLRERVKFVYTIGSAAEKIERELQGVVKMVSAGSMDVAVHAAAEAAVAGDVVLLAPACSSFDQFENYEHRGRVFREIVSGL
jgi:UDP-N-acetylmuramoylalanine--D-glutamate ligase